MTDKFQQKYRIPSARYPHHNYDGGAYFVTICTAGMQHYFGEISDGNMHLSEIGLFASAQIENVSHHYPYAEIPVFVVMPNHVHLIVFIDGVGKPRRDVACNVSNNNSNTDGIDKNVVCNVSNNTSNTDGIDKDVACNVSNDTADNTHNFIKDVACNVSTGKRNEQMSAISPKPGSLSTVIRGIKSAVTRYANQNKITFSWQPRFHDRIIRDQNEMNNIADYIENNAINWNLDDYCM